MTFSLNVLLVTSKSGDNFSDQQLRMSESSKLYPNNVKDKTFIAILLGNFHIRGRRSLLQSVPAIWLPDWLDNC